MRYQLRYTHDLLIAAETDADWQAWTTRRHDYMMHVVDTHTSAIVWQNGPSIRYGMVGVQ